jgi:CRISPR-associated protein Cas1
MKTVYVADHRARVRVQKANLLVQGPAGSSRVPIETVEALVLAGRANISNEATGELVRRGIRIAAVSKTGRLRFSIVGPTQGNVLLRLEQFRAAADAASTLEIAKVIVAGKLQNSRRAMQRWAWDQPDRVARQVIESDVEAIAERLGSLATARDGDTVRGIEGDGARRYFRAMALHLGSADNAFAFERRSRRPPRDPANALLSFVYGLVLVEVVGALESVGLDPQVGFLHSVRPGRPSLGLDLLEEFRPAIADRFVASIFRRHQVSVDDFDEGAGRAIYLSDAGRRKVLSLYDENRQREIRHPLLDRPIPTALLPMTQATLLARFLRGDLPTYPPFVLGR